MITRPILISAFLLISLLSTRFLPRQPFSIAGFRLSDNVVVIGEDGITDEQRDQLIQDVIIASALREYFDWRGDEIDLNVPPTCYTINENDEAIVTECPIEAP